MGTDGGDGRPDVRLVTARWRFALTEHEHVLGEYLLLARTFPEERWQREPSTGRWSAAALTLHVADAYRFGYDAASGGAGMRLRVPRLVALLSRTVIFPVMLWRKTFPREAPAPREVRPDLALAHTLTREALIERLVHEAGRAITALQQPGARRVTHAYFGSLAPYQALRLLTARTRHHAAGMRERMTG